MNNSYFVYDSVGESYIGVFNDRDSAQSFVLSMEEETNESGTMSVMELILPQDWYEQQILELKAAQMSY
jgi:hypothetical protein